MDQATAERLLAERQAAERIHAECLGATAERLGLPRDPLYRLDMGPGIGAGSNAGAGPLLCGPTATTEQSHTHTHSHTHLHLHQPDAAAPPTTMFPPAAYHPLGVPPHMIPTPGGFGIPPGWSFIILFIYLTVAC